VARGLVLPVLAVTVATMSACDVNGGESPALSGEEYAQQVTAIYCDRSEYPARPGDDFDLPEYAAYADQALPLLEKAVGQIRELQPHRALAREADHFVRSLEELVSKSRAARDAARRGDLEDFVTAHGDVFAAGLIVETRGKDIGLRDC
jgi:hypothetical protein